MSEAAQYRVFPAGDEGGKTVAVYEGHQGLEASELLVLAARTGAPLTVFAQRPGAASLSLRVFRPDRERGQSDSATLAALTQAVQTTGSDLVEVRTGQSTQAAQWCPSRQEWLLDQGVVAVQVLKTAELAESLTALGLPVEALLHRASSARPNLVLELPELPQLDAFVPDAVLISRLNEVTQTTGLILYTTQAPQDGPQRRAAASFRAFGPLKGFLEDAASSNMAACLVGVLLDRGRLSPDPQLLRLAQRQPGAPALLTAQCAGLLEKVWVGGEARRLVAERL